MTGVTFGATARLDVPDFSGLAVTGGGYGTRTLDLFATHSVTTTLNGIGERPASALVTARALLQRATPNGMGETLGAPPDGWSTTYGAGTLDNLGFVAPRTWATFLASLERDGGYSMFPSGAPDSWATGFVARSLALLAPSKVNKAALAGWIGSAQAADGGITWTPEDARSGVGDVRATGFALDALRELDAVPLLAGYADIAALVGFVVGRQSGDGGFSLNACSQPCMWGTGEAVAVLDALGIPISNKDAVVAFVMTYYDESVGGFRRGPEYDTRADVWATRQAVRVLRIVAPERLEMLASAISAFFNTCELPTGGYTYTTVRYAGDVLSSAAAVLAGHGTDQTAHWITKSVMPGGDGFAFMPGRGAEARTSQWATAALDAANVSYDPELLLTWATRAQNRDGGFGRWAGRASEPMSTTAVIATLTRAGVLGRLPQFDRLTQWVSEAVSRFDATKTNDARTAASLVRAAVAVTVTSADDIDLAPCVRVLDGLEIDGGFRRTARAVPDILTTYAALVARQALGDGTGLARARNWVNHLGVDAEGVAWSPAGSGGGGLLATALATLITNTAEGVLLPDLSL